MGLETDRQTIHGLLVNRGRVENVEAFLRDFTPENEVVKADVHKARGLAHALGFSLRKLDMDCNDLANATLPSGQMTIDDVLKAAKKGETALTAAALEQVAAAAEGEPMEEPEPEPEHPTAPEPPPEAAAPEPATETTALELVKLLREAQPHRGWTVGAVLPMDHADRAAARSWCEHGAPDPVPSVVSRQILEDLKPMAYTEHARTLLSWVDVHLPADFAWASTLHAEAASWAMAMHRVARGESGVEVPEMPATFLPPETIYGKILELDGADVGREGIVEALKDECPAVGYAVDALAILVEEMGEVVDTEELESIPEPWLEPLAMIAINLGAHRPGLEGVTIPQAETEEEPS